MECYIVCKVVELYITFSLRAAHLQKSSLKNTKKLYGIFITSIRYTAYQVIVNEKKKINPV